MQVARTIAKLFPIGLVPLLPVIQRSARQIQTLVPHATISTKNPLQFICFLEPLAAAVMCAARTTSFFFAG